MVRESIKIQNIQGFEFVAYIPPVLQGASREIISEGNYSGASGRVVGG